MAALSPADGRFRKTAQNGRRLTEVARVPCDPETRSAKAANSEIRSVSRPGGPNVISSARFKGELVAHRIMPPAGS